MRVERPVGIVVAMEEELLPFRALLSGLGAVPGRGPWETWEGFAGARRVVVAVSDCGPANAAAALEGLVARFDPEVVLSSGAAGAHDPGLLPGDVVVGARYRILVPPVVQEERRRRGLHPKGFRFRRGGRRHHSDVLEAPAGLVARAVAIGEDELRRLGPWTGGWPEGVEARDGRLLAGVVGSADAWTTRGEDLRELHAFYGSLCEDMESAFLAQLCALHRLPFLSVRTLSNNDLRSPLAPGDVSEAISLAGERSARIVARLAADGSLTPGPHPFGRGPGR